MGKHYIPQEYLRGFAADALQTFVWMYDKQAGEWRRPAISKAAQQRDYFTPEVENQLNERVESRGHRALGTLRTEHALDSEMGGDLLSYIAVMLMRVPRRRRQSLAIVPGSIESVINRTRDELSGLRSAGTETRISELQEELGRIEAGMRGKISAEMQEEVDSPWPTRKILEGIHSMCWRLVTVPEGSPLITSDNPVFYFSEYGIGSAASEVTFPISPRVALLGSRQGPQGEVIVLRGKRPIAKEIARRMVVGADRFIFASYPHPWVAKISGKTEVDLTRIQWHDVE